MRGLFSLDSSLMRFLDKIADLMILNLLFVVCCVPVVTIGPALTALHYTAFKLRAGEEGAVLRTFLRSFRQNFRQGTVIGLLMLLAGGFLAFDLRTVWGGPAGGTMRFAVTAAALAYLMVLLYVFPLLARFDNSVTATIRNAFALSVTSLPRTASMLMLVAACVMLTLYNAETIKYGILAWLLLGFSSVTYANTFLLEKTFAKYTSQ